MAHKHTYVADDDGALYCECGRHAHTWAGNGETGTAWRLVCPCGDIAAHGPATVYSAHRAECHAPTVYSRRAYKSRERKIERDKILRFWQACDWATHTTVEAAYAMVGIGGRDTVREYVNATKRNDVWMLRDVLGDGHWMVAQWGAGEGAYVGEFSHIISAIHNGAWCACNLVPENEADNRARADADVSRLGTDVRATLAVWRDYWTRNYARKASLARL